MATTRKPKQQYNPISATRGDVFVSFTPKSHSQNICAELWNRSRVLFLIGEAGTGKTAAALALSLIELFKSQVSRPVLMLSRPMVQVDNDDIGFLPGTADEKIFPFLAPFRDVLDDITQSNWEKLQKVIDIQTIPIGMLRGRTVKNGILIVDEAQETTYNQIVCALTRIGRNGKVIFCGDSDQSSRFDKIDSPLLEIANKLHDVDTISTINFTDKDQIRDPLVSEILKRL